MDNIKKNTSKISDDEYSEIVTELYKKFETKVRNQAKKALRSPEDVEDVVQETFLRIWKYRENIPEIRVMGAWINVITNSIICDRIKSLKKHNYIAFEELSENEENNPSLISKSPEPLKSAEDKNFIEDLHEALSCIKNEQRQNVWKLRYIETFTTREISEKLNKKPELIRRWNRTTTAELRVLLSKKGYSLEN